MKLFFYHSSLSLFLLVMFCITGGGNLAKAQSTVTLDFEGSGAFPYNADWTITNLSVYSSLNHTTSGSNSANTSGKESAVAQYKNKLENISKVVYYISKTSTNAKPSYFLVETSIDGKNNWVDQGHSPTFDKITQGEWTEVTVTLATPVTGYVRVRYIGTSAVRLIDDITVHYEPALTGTKDPELSYSSSSLTIAANGTLTQPTLNNPYDVTINYSSSNPSVATVTDEGVIALAGGTGTATITATSQADATYKEGTATYELTVFGAPEITPEGGEYAKSVDVAISATDAAALWYTTDGSEPTIDNAAATKVTAFPVNLNFGLGEHTVKAITAYDAEGTILSDVETRTYNVLDKEVKVVEISSFSAVNGDIDAVVSYSTSKGGANNAPYLTSGKQIRLYQINGSNSYGGTITISAAGGYKLSSVTIGSSTATSISYTLDEDTNLSIPTSLSANKKFTKEGLVNGSITFYCMSTTERLNVNYISVTYVSTATGTTDPELSYSPSTLTIAANGTLTQPELNKPNGVTIKSYSSSNTSVATVTDKGVIALAGRTGTATITATSQANDTYKAGTATYTLTVFGAPEITPESGEYENNVTVRMNATGAGALFYTTDGTDPRDDIDAATMVTEFPYNLPLSVGTHTIKAVTADENLDVYSDVLTRTYTVVLAVPTPQLSQAAGNYNYEVAVDVTVANSGGAVGYVYTTDGTDPANSGTATTVNALTGTVTLYKGEHTLTVKSFTAEKANFSDAATAAYTVALPQPVIKLSAESTQEQPITVTIEAEGASHIYYSTDGTDPTATSNSVVEVGAATTEFTLSEIGSYTIKAIALNSALDASDAATRTCTISKVVPVPGSATMKYKKVTSMEDIVDGGVYLLACPSKNVIMSDRVTKKNYTACVTYNFSGNEDLITDIKNLNVSGGPCEITLEKVADKANTYYIRYANGGQYLYNTSDTSLSFSDEINVNNLTQYQWTISITSHEVIDGGPVDAIQIQNNKNNSRSLDYSYSNPRYAVYQYQTSQNAPSFLYKKTFDLSVNANTAGYATAYTAFPYVMPAGADGYIITETAEGATIKAKNKYPAGAEVPANAPLLIKNSEAGVTLNPVVLGKTVEAYPYAEENLLHGTRRESDGVTTDVDGTDNYYYYKLSYKLDAGNPVPDSYGFYRGKADGTAFEMKNTLTAYLALPKSSGLVNNLRISIDNEDGPATSIQTNRLPADNMPQSVYTLSGVRVNAAGNRLPKGIYIVNGKKVVIK